MNIIILIIIIFLAASAASVAGYYIYWYAFKFEPVNFKLSEIDISIGNSKSNKKEPLLTILHLSDFHLRKDRKGKKLFKFVQGLQSIKPDLLVLTGDLVEKDCYFDYLIEMLSGFRAKLGKYAIFGVHDYYNKSITEFAKNMLRKKRKYRRQNDVDTLISRLDSIGIKVLRNENVTHRLGKTRGFKKDFFSKGNSATVINELQIIGVEDSMLEKADIDIAFKGIEGDYKKYSIMTKKRIKDYFKPGKKDLHRLNNKGKIRLCLTHTPDMKLIADMASRGADIVLCGHTHGGQIRLPKIGALISGCKIKTKYASGLFYFKNFILYTTRGLGEGRYSPFRFYCHPEASLIRVYVIND